MQTHSEFWNVAFLTAFDAFYEGRHGSALAHCCHNIDRYVDVYPESIIAQWQLTFTKFEKEILKENAANRSHVNHKNQNYTRENRNGPQTLRTKIAQLLPKNLLEKMEELSEQIDQDSEGKCKCPVSSDTEIARWYILKAFIIYKMILTNEISHEDTHVKLGRLMLHYAVRVIHIARLCNDQEFEYLKKECKLKMVVLYVDYLDRPWEARAVLTKLKQTSPLGPENQDAFIEEYIKKTEYQCMMWYIRRSRKRKPQQ